jgi:hypothetical protein
MATGDGAPADEDRVSDGILPARFAAIRPVAKDGPTAPESLLPGDVVIAVDARRMRFAAAHFAGPQ